MSVIETGHGGLPSTKFAPTEQDPFERIGADAKPFWGRSVWLGYLTIFLFFGGFGGFAAFASLDSSVMAPGEVRVDRELRPIQHDETARVKEILVREGDEVKQGQILVRLDPLRVQEETRTAEAQLVALRSNLARFRAERSMSGQISFPDDLLRLAEGDPEVRTILENERDVFQQRIQRHFGSLELRQEQINQSKTLIEGLEIEREALLQQLSFIQEELQDVNELFRQGLERKARVLALQRTEASLQGRAGSLQSDIARQRQRISELELQMNQIETEFHTQAAENIDGVNIAIQNARSKKEINDDRLDRLEIRAPQDGTIINMEINTTGQVIGAGMILMEIVPSDEQLVVVGKIKPKDIDAVQKGVKKVQVRLTAFSQRFTHPVQAHLKSISADTITGDGPAHYRVVAEIDQESLDTILPGVPLSSGMPAMVMVGVGESTLLSYLLEPLYLSWVYALREPTATSH